MHGPPFRRPTKNVIWMTFVKYVQTRYTLLHGKLTFLDQAFKVYTKVASDATFDELEMAFRSQNFNTYLIATENELGKTLTYVNLQGELNKTFKVGFQFSSKPKRETAKQGWPETPEENLERLKDAGFPMDRGIPKCNRCDGRPSYLSAPNLANNCSQSSVTLLALAQRRLLRTLTRSKSSASTATKLATEFVTARLHAWTNLHVVTASKSCHGLSIKFCIFNIIQAIWPYFG